MILNTFYSFEQDALDVLSTMFPPIYIVGPLPLLADQISNGNMKNIGSLERIKCYNKDLIYF